MGKQDRARSPFRSRIEVLRPHVLLGVIGLAIATPQCVWTDLDAYSSEFGRVVGPDGGLGGSNGMPDAESCACAVGQECVNGVCETCMPTWTYDHKGLRQGDQRGIDHVYDPAKKTLYVVSARQSGQDPSRAYLAELHTCRGSLLRELDSPAVGGEVLSGLQVVRRYGDTLFAKFRQDNPAIPTGGFAVYDAKSSSFTGAIRAPRFNGASLGEELWSLEVTPAGKVWMYGGWKDANNVLTPLALRSDGQDKSCVSDYVEHSPAAGRAIATNNDDVYMVVPVGGEVRIQHFKDSKCDLTLCNCPSEPALTSLTFMDMPPWVQVMAAKVVGNSLVVIGFYGKTDLDWIGFVAQYNFVTSLWGSPYFYNPTASLDGFTMLDSDGSSVYVATFKNYDPVNQSTSGTAFYVFGLPITSASSPKIIDAPNIQGAYALTLDGDGFFATGYNPSNGAEGRSIRCTLDACP